MSFDWNKAVDKHYDKKKATFSLLENLVKETITEINNKKLLKEAVADPSNQDEQGSFKLPPVKIAETWGRLENGDRERLWRFARNLQGGTLEAKIAQINKYLTTPAQGADVNELLSVMMITEILSNILTDFTESAAGFIFEAFLAGLFGQDSVQIVDVEGVEDEDDSQGEGQKGKPITDVVLGGKHYSLKLLKAKGMLDPKTGKKSAGTQVKGSWRNMLSHLLSQPEVTYLDVRKEASGQQLSFGEVTVKLENLHKIFIDPFLQPVAKGKAVTIKDVDQFIDLVINQAKNDPFIGRSVVELNPDLPDETEEFVRQYAKRRPGPLQEDLGPNERQFTIDDFADMSNNNAQVLRDKFEDVRFPTDIKYRPLGQAPILFRMFGGADNMRKFYDLSKQYEDNPNEQTKAALFAIIKKLPDVVGKVQFAFSQKQFESISEFKHVGSLNLEEGGLKQLWLQNAQLLEQTIAPVYRAFDDFSNSIENYFTSGQGDQGRKAYGDKAIASSADLNKTTTAAVTKMEAARDQNK